MNIGIFIHGLGSGGAERVVCNLSNYLCKKHNVTIITFSSITPSYKLDKKIIKISLEEEPVSSNFITKNIKRLIKLNQIIKQQNQDIFLTFLPVPSFMLLLFRKRIKVPIIVSVRNDPKVEYSSKIFNLLMKLLYPSADGFIFQTEEAKEYFNNIIKKYSEVIPNPINEDFIAKSFKGERKKIIVSVGRLAEQKNHMLLINAFEKISHKYCDYKLIIYGEGTLRTDLENKIKELNLQDRIELPGNVKEIKNHIYNASLFVLSSNYEGMPNSLMEAMALGLPVISTDCPCGGPKFLIKNEENGILVPVNNCNLMIEAINQVLSNREFSNNIGEQAVKIVDTLNPTKVYEEWEKYIIQCTK